jgi:hypothetical protein
MLIYAFNKEILLYQRILTVFAFSYNNCNSIIFEYHFVVESEPNRYGTYRSGVEQVMLIEAFNKEILFYQRILTVFAFPSNNCNSIFFKYLFVVESETNRYGTYPSGV